MSSWYIAGRDELLIDLDDYMRPTRSGCPWGEEFFRRRLRTAILSRKLNVDEVWLIRSQSERHYQAIVKLRAGLKTLPRLVWQLHLGSDLYRGRADLMRLANGFHAPSLLIIPHSIPGFYRCPNFVCECTEKHVTSEQAELGDKACPVWREVRGFSPWELFGEPVKGPEKFVPLPLGKVDLDLITEVRREGDS